MVGYSSGISASGVRRGGLRTDRLKITELCNPTLQLTYMGHVQKSGTLENPTFAYEYAR